MTDIQRDETKKFSPAGIDDRGTGSFKGRTVSWSTDSKWLMVMDDPGLAGGGGGMAAHAGVLRWDGRYARLLSDVSYYGDSQDIWAAWLPSQVNPADLAAPLPDPLSPVSVEPLPLIS